MVAELLMGPQPIAEFAKKSRADQLTFTGWRVDGWVRWLAGLRGQYERRMNRMCNLLEDGRFHLKQGTPTKSSESDWAVISKTELYSFDWPRAGMFVWIRMYFDSHPLAKEVDGPTLGLAFWIFLTREPYKVLLAPGSIFSPTPEIMAEKGWQYFRACFAAVEEDDIERCSKGFAEGAKAFWLIKDKKDLPSADEEGIQQEGLLDLGMKWAC